MHVAYASFSFACAAPVTAVAALFFAFVVAARPRNPSREANRELSRIVLRRQPASRPPMTAIAYDTLKNEARHVA